MSGGEGIDYMAVIADLEAKITALQGMVASMRAALASGALGPAGLDFKGFLVH